MESKITINGVSLTPGQVTTIRFGLGDFARKLERDGLGDDDHGRNMTHLYLRRVHEIIELMESE